MEDGEIPVYIQAEPLTLETQLPPPPSRQRCVADKFRIDGVMNSSYWRTQTGALVAGTGT